MALRPVRLFIIASSFFSSCYLYDGRVDDIQTVDRSLAVAADSSWQIADYIITTVSLGCEHNAVLTAIAT